ncbi:MAG: TraB/GumN family protein [Clostridia bacterium]|nr:TraB/GumN family protein [Clostridia bacterium]
MKFKKCLSLLLSVALCITLAACTTRPAATSDSAQDTTANSATTTVTTTLDEPSTATTVSASTTQTTVTTIQKNSTTTTARATTTSRTTKATKPVPTTKRPTPTIPQQKPTATPLLYKVTDDQGHVIWLFGSIHVGQSSFYPLPNYVMDAFNEADSLAVEFDIIAYENDIHEQSRVLSLMLHPERDLLPDYIPTEIFDEAYAILDSYGLYHKDLEFFIPIFWSDIIDSITNELIGANSDLGIDRHLLNLAYEKNKTIIDVESAESQCQMMVDFSDDLQLLLLQSSIIDYYHQDVVKATMKDMMNIWEKGNEQELEEATEITYSGSDDNWGYLWEYKRAMVTERNYKMTNFAEEALASGGDVFICVGAAHVVGEEGMADLLKERGYTVEVVR